MAPLLTTADAEGFISTMAELAAEGGVVYIST
jgi:hypothetical protein